MMDDSDDDGSQIFEAEYQEDVMENDDYDIEIIGNLPNNYSISEPMDETSSTVDTIINEDPENVKLIEKFSQESFFKVNLVKKII